MIPAACGNRCPTSVRRWRSTTGPRASAWCVSTTRIMPRPEMWAHTEAVANQLAEAGAEVEEIPLPDSFAVVHSFQRIVMNVECAGFHEVNHRTRAADYGPRIRAGMEMGMIMPTSAYLKAQRLRRQFRADFSEMVDKVDVVMTPAIPAPAPRDLNTTGDAAFQVPWTAAGLPTVVVSTGPERAGDADGGAVRRAVGAGGSGPGRGAVVRADRWVGRGAADRLTTPQPLNMICSVNSRLTIE